MKSELRMRIAHARADLFHVNACIALFQVSGEPSDLALLAFGSVGITSAPR
jgi:hypothetical protein